MLFWKRNECESNNLITPKNIQQTQVGASIRQQPGQKLQRTKNTGKTLWGNFFGENSDYWERLFLGEFGFWRS